LQALAAVARIISLDSIRASATLKHHHSPPESGQYVF
jgi:hypothetical protein